METFTYTKATGVAAGNPGRRTVATGRADEIHRRRNHSA